MKTLTINFDGGNAGGISTWAVIARTEDKVLAKLTGLVDSSLPQTNNVAEWWALYMGAVYAYTQRFYYKSFMFKGDSELVVKQANGEYAVSNVNLRGLWQKTLDTLRNLDYKIIWIPREENSEVDGLGRILR